MVWKVYRTKKVTECYIRPHSLLVVFKNVQGCKKRSVRFSNLQQLPPESRPGASSNTKN